MPTEGSFSAWYFEHRFPISPRSYATILKAGGEPLAGLAADFAALEDAGLAECTRARGRAETPARRDAPVEPASPPRRSQTALHVFNGRGRQSGELPRLHELLECQAYRIAYWRVAAEEINYRRFFNINELAGLRMEVPRAVRRRRIGWSSRLIERGEVQGLRIDHIDGLFDPPGLLRSAAGDSSQSRSMSCVEKILARYERLPRLADRRQHRLRFHQPGARALCRSGRAKRAMTRLYRRFTEAVEQLRRCAATPARNA